jgi:hypothetical protein
LVDARRGWYITGVTFTIELEREEDGRWIAEVPALPGVLCYGRDRDEAVAGVLSQVSWGQPAGYWRLRSL